MNTVKSAPAPVEAPRAKPPARQLLSLPEQIAERIFSAIASGEYAPGVRIREEALSEQFEVSRGPVREALRILEKDSVVRILPNRGAHVTQLSIKEVDDIFEIRRDLVGAMVRRLDPCDEALITRIEAEVRELDALAKEPGSADAFVAASYRLGHMLADASGNHHLADVLGKLARQTRRYTRLGLASAARRRESARTWRAMLKALKAGDMNSAGVAVETLIDASRHEAARQLQAALASNPREMSHTGATRASDPVFGPIT